MLVYQRVFNVTLFRITIPLEIAIRWRTEAFEAPNVEDLIEAEYRPGHWKTGVDNGEIYPSKSRLMGFFMGFDRKSLEYTVIG